MTQKSRPPKRQGTEIPAGWQDPLRQQHPLVSLRWLIRTFAAALAAALLCSYLTLCVLFYQGRWQMIFHPTHGVSATPANAGMRFEEIRFDSTETGQPQLAGWWMPAEPGARYSESTLLYLHGASGSLSDTVPRLSSLHARGISIFAFDYRGFGLSRNTHPSEASLYEDAEAAVAYLGDTRKLDAKRIVLYGEGLGATIAAEMALRHPQVAALILDNPMPPALELIASDPRTRLLPVRLLVADRFELASKLKHMTTPKLFVQSEVGVPGSSVALDQRLLYNSAADPKRFIPGHGSSYSDGVRKFLEDALRVP